MRQKFVLRVKEKEAELKDAERELHSRDAMQQINFRQGWGAGAGLFWLLGAGAARKKYQEPEPLGKKIRSRSRLEKVRSQSR